MGLGTKLDFNSRRAGMPANYDKGYTNNVGPGVTNQIAGAMDQPMLAILHYVSTIGDLSAYTGDISSGAGQAGLEYYNYVRSHNASLASYNKNDIFKVTIAIAELYALHDELVRDFKFMYKQDFLNLGFNDLALPAFGLNSIINDQANYAARLNRAAKDLEKFPVLKGIAYFDDLLYVSNNIFADDQINKAGTIAFAKSQILIYDTSATSPTVGNLVYTNLYAQSFNTKLTLLENTIKEYNSDQDISNICSEILKAEGMSFYPLARLPMDNLDGCAKDFHRVFDWEIYDRIANATIYPIKTTFASTEVAGIAENSAGVLCYGIDTVTNLGVSQMEAANYDGSGTNSNQMFRPDEHKSFVFAHTEDPSEDAVMQFLAHHEHIDSANNASARFFRGLSLIHIERCQIYFVNSVAGYNVTNFTVTTLPHQISDMVVNINNGLAAVDVFLRRKYLYDSFGCLPNVWALLYSSDSGYTGKFYVQNLSRDIDNFANIDSTTLMNIKANYTRGAFYISSSSVDKENKFAKFGKGKNYKKRGGKTPDKTPESKDPESKK